MDEVDFRYKNSIREALQTGNVANLVQLIPGMSEERAIQCINEWKINYAETIQKIKNGLDTTNLENALNNLLNSLLEEANLSGYHKKNSQ